MEKLKIRLLQGIYAVCQIKETEKVPSFMEEKVFFLLQKQKMRYQL